MTPRKLDVIDVHDAEPVAFLPLDSARHTLALLENCFAPQARRQGYSASAAAMLARIAALHCYADGWRSSESIMHRADNPIPATRPPHLPTPLRLAA